MKTEDALQFLRDRQPMPSDHAITEEEGRIYASVIRHFERKPDSRCVPLFIGSVGNQNGLGMYEHIKFVLLRHGKEDVVPHLAEALRKSNDEVRARCIWWACDIEAWELSDEISSLRHSTDRDVRDAAEVFLELRNEN